jgi:hypothetical protein
LLIRCVDQNGPSICRSTILKDGDCLYRIDARAAEDVYEDLAEDFLVTLSSFHPLHPEGRPTAEPLVDAAYEAPVPFVYQRLKSWDAEEIHADEDRRVLRIVSKDEGEAIGRITLEIRKRGAGLNRERLAREYSDTMKESGVHLSGAAIAPTEPPKGFQSAAVYQPSAQFEGHQLDAPVLLFEHEEALVLVSLLGPSREESPEWWAINKRAFEIVRDSLRLGSG